MLCYTLLGAYGQKAKKAFPASERSVRMSEDKPSTKKGGIARLRTKGQRHCGRKGIHCGTICDRGFGQSNASTVSRGSRAKRSAPSIMTRRAGIHASMKNKD